MRIFKSNHTVGCHASTAQFAGEACVAGCHASTRSSRGSMPLDSHPALAPAPRAIMVLILTLFFAATARAADPATTSAPANAPRALIASVTSQAVAILRDTTLTSGEKVAKIRDIAYANIDFDTLARLTLGRNGRDLTDAQRKDFLQEYRTHIANTYSHITDDYHNEDITVTSDREEARGDWSVQTRIMGDKNGVRDEVAKVEYRLRKTNDQWKIMDITIDGVSLMANFRSQFQDIINNGSFDRLLKLLREKNAAAAK